MKIVTEQFTFTQVMNAAGLKPVQFQNWLKSTAVKSAVKNATKSADSGDVVIHSDGIRGKERTFSYYALMTFVTAKVLVDIRLSPKRAFELALRFSATDDIQGKTREVGLPCHPALGDTYLISDGPRDAIVTRKEGEEWDDVFQKASLYSEGSAPARLTVNLSKLFERVMIGMNRDPGELLNGAYGEVSG